jgi:putative transposase
MKLSVQIFLLLRPSRIARPPYASRSREAAQECSPRRKPWEKNPEKNQAPKERKNVSHTAGNLVLHMIFSTKDRQSLITPEIRTDLFAYLGGIIREMNGTALIINGVADHVHMLIRIRPVQSAAEIARVVKANSSRWVHEKWNLPFAWQTGYGAFSVSESNVAAVSQYIAMQEQHHKKLTFKDEYLACLKKNKIAYDERFGPRFLRPFGLRLLGIFRPTACAVGCILAPLRDYGHADAGI